MYIGKNGLLYAEWWNGSVNPILSRFKVYDGIWHQVTLSTTRPDPDGCKLLPALCTGRQYLAIDGQSQGFISGDLNGISGNWSNPDFGAGYAGGAWPSYPNNNTRNGNEGWLTYFNGELSNINLTSN